MQVLQNGLNWGVGGTYTPNHLQICAYLHSSLGSRGRLSLDSTDGPLPACGAEPPERIEVLAQKKLVKILTETR